MKLSVVILAAGRGSRMGGSKPKVLECIMEKPMLGWVIDAALALNPSQLIVVTGYGADLVEKYINSISQYKQKVQIVKQQEQLGTGHAVLQAMDIVDSANQVLVLLGDVPGVVAAELAGFIAKVDTGFGLLTAKLDNPGSFGRVVRNSENNIVAIVEQQDASLEQQSIKEINTGIVSAPADFIKSALTCLVNKSNIKSKEYYFLDILPDWLATGNDINSCMANDSELLCGANTRLELYALEKLMQARLLTQWLNAGVIIHDINTVSIRGDVVVEPGAVLDVNVILIGKTIVKSGAVVGAGAYIKNCEIDNYAKILPYSVCQDVTIKANATIGPFAVVSANSEIGESAYIGSFVEVKRSVIGTKVKAKHLSYLGDAVIGDGSNIGAGVITCNYDGANKHKTTINSGSFIGAGVNLVAPITVEDQAFVAAGTTLRNNVPAKSLAITAVKPRFLANWVRPVKIID